MVEPQRRPLHLFRWPGTVDIQPAHPQRRAIAAVAGVVSEGGVIAYPTAPATLWAGQLGNLTGIERIKGRIRKLETGHHSPGVQGFRPARPFVHVPNRVFRGHQAATPGSTTFILKRTK